MRSRTIVALRVVVGLEILARALVLALSPRAAEAFARTGRPNALRLILAWTEVAAALLFLAPGTLAVGAWSLLAVFVAAAGLHVLHGEFDVGGLLVLAVAVLVVLSHRPPRVKGVPAVSRHGGGDE
jgi:hypothetical protein